MKSNFRLGVVATFAAGVLGAAAFAAPEYGVIRTIHIGGDGAFDYLRVDATARRLYVTHGNRVEVIEVDTGAPSGAIEGLKRAHGVALAPEAGHGFATSGGANEIIMFDSKTLAPLKTIKSTGTSPDAIEYDPGTKRIYVANHGSGQITVLDPASGDVVGTVDFGAGKLEGIGFDGDGNGYVNSEDESAVRVFDLRSLRPKAKWSSAPGEGGTGLAVDAQHYRVFSACANGKLVVLDTTTGKVVATPAIDEDPDALVFEPKTQQLFVPCVGGSLNIVHEDAPDTYTAVQTLATRRGCRTIALDEKTGAVITVAPKYAAAAGKRPAPVADTFEALVIGTK